MKDIQKQADEMRQERVDNNKSLINNCINDKRDDSLAVSTSTNHAEYEYNLALQPMTSDVSSTTDMLSKHYSTNNKRPPIASKTTTPQAKEAAQMVNNVLLNYGSIDSAVKSVKSIISKQNHKDANKDKSSYQLPSPPLRFSTGTFISRKSSSSKSSNSSSSSSH